MSDVLGEAFSKYSLPTLSSGGILKNVVLICGVGMIIYMVWRMYQYRHEVLVWDATQGVLQTKKDKARIKRDEAGNEVWELQKEKKVFKAPGRKGIGLLPSLIGGVKKFAQLYKHPDGSTNWMKLDPKTIDKKIKEWPVELTPMPAEERWVYHSEAQIASTYGVKSWIKQNLPMIVGSTMILLLFFGFFIFYEDLWAPIQQYTGRLDAMESRFFTHQERWMDFVEGRQNLDRASQSLQTSSGETIPNTAPGEPPR